jgi:hypothetical protein
MRKTRINTIAVSEEAYLKARVWAARHGISMSGGLAFLIEYLEQITKIVQQLRQDEPDMDDEIIRRRN